MTFTPSATTLVGDELLSFYTKNLGELSKTEMAKATGYTSETKDGKVRCNFSALNDAVMAAAGLQIGGKKGPGGRSLSYIARVHGNGTLLIGSAYTKKFGLESGNEFEIKLSKNTGTIRLVPVGASEEDE